MVSLSFCVTFDELCVSVQHLLKKIIAKYLKAAEQTSS